MIHGYLIMTHNNLESLLIQIRELDDSKCRFFIHIDKKTQGVEENPAYKKLQEMDRVTFIQDRINVQWGSIRMIDATILLLSEAIKHPELEYIHLLSGQCFPVKTGDYINDYLSNHYGKQFMEYFPIPVKTTQGWGMQRMALYHFHEFYDPRSKKLKDIFIKFGNDVLRNLQKGVNMKRSYPAGFPPVLYGGSQWWSISIDCALFFVQYVKDHPEVYRRFRHTQAPDESFFQTILLNSDYKGRVINNNLRFYKFKPNTSFATEVTSEDIPACMKTDTLFARKFTNQNIKLWEDIMQRQSNMKYIP